MAFEVSVFGLGRRFLAMFRSFEMHLSCLVSDFVMGGVIWCLCDFVMVVSLAISFGQGGSNLFFLHHFCRYVYLVGGDVFSFCELLDG